MVLVVRGGGGRGAKIALWYERTNELQPGGGGVWCITSGAEGGRNFFKSAIMYPFSARFHKVQQMYPFSGAWVHVPIL